MEMEKEEGREKEEQKSEAHLGQRLKVAESWKCTLCRKPVRNDGVDVSGGSVLAKVCREEGSELKLLLPASRYKDRGAKIPSKLDYGKAIEPKTG